MSSLKMDVFETLSRPRTVLWVALVTSFLFLTACTIQQDLPESARQALEERLLALPGGDPELTIGQAWPGVNPQNDPGSSMEIWCVEVDHSPTDETDPELIWIVMRPNQQSEWAAAMLATMSSSWPYETCVGFK